VVYSRDLRVEGEVINGNGAKIDEVRDLLVDLAITARAIVDANTTT
jgi:hypothetical protein